MTNTNQASELYELCKEVYKRTKWDGNDLFHRLGDEVFHRELFDSDVDEKHPRESYYPLYTSDYLLEKLPKSLVNKEKQYGARFGMINLTLMLDGTWDASYRFEDEMNPPDFQFDNEADTPLKALLKLTIALSEAGELDNE